MTEHRFTVNIPNPTAERVSVQLRLKAAKHLDLYGFPGEIPKDELKVTGAGLTLDECAKKGEPQLKLRLEPFTSVDVQVIINTTQSNKPGVAGFNLIDRRNGMEAGGVLLVCMNPPFVEPIGQTISTPNPCPAAVVRDLYVILPGDDPSEPSTVRPIQLGDTLELVAQVTNPTGQPLEETQVYLEHIGTSNIEFTPGTWNIGTLQEGDVFYATWQIRMIDLGPAFYETSIVVVSQDHDPVRLNGKISLEPRANIFPALY